MRAALLLAAALSVAAPLSRSQTPASRKIAALAQPPVVFEANRGQAPSEADFIVHTRGAAVLLTASGAHFSTSTGGARLRLEGLHEPRAIEGLDPTGGVSNYLIGSGPSSWRTGIPHYARVRYTGIYRGIDIVWYARGRDLEFDFILRPGADPRDIVMRWEGTGAVKLDDRGDVVVPAGSGEIRQRPPRVYQRIAGRVVEVGARYKPGRGGRVTLDLDLYDSAAELIVDPVLSFATLLGGSGRDFVADIAVDSSGNVYLAGSTGSVDFPVSNGAVSTALRGGGDAFVTKLNPTGTAIVYSTYLGGAGSTSFVFPFHIGDLASAIAVDPAGNAFIACRCGIAATPGAFNNDGSTGFGFIVKLNQTGSAILFAAHLGRVELLSIAIDGAGNSYVTGSASLGFPSTPGAFDTSINIPSGAFVAKLNAAGSELVYSTFLGGSAFDSPDAIAVDSAGNAYVGGNTTSPDFPTTPGAFRRTRTSTNTGEVDLFVTKLNPSGTALVYSTYLGRGGFGGLAVDSAGSAYVAGATASAGFPVTPGAFDTTYNGAGDGFVAKLRPGGDSLAYSTFVGGLAADGFNAVSVDPSGAVWIAGSTSSADFPVTSDALDSSYTAGHNDGVVVQLNNTGTGMLYSTFIGGVGRDSVDNVALDAAGNTYFSANVESADVPLSQGALQRTFAGVADIYVFKLAPTPSAPAPPTLTSVSAASFAANGPLAPLSIVTGFGSNLSTASEVAATPLPTALAGVSVRVRDSAGTERLALLIYVFPGQLSFLIPDSTRTGAATIEVLRAGQVVARGMAQIESVAPALFTANSNGSGVAAALALRVAADGRQSSQPIFTCPSAGNCVASPIDLGANGEQVVLLLFGTGIRGLSNATAARATIGGVDCAVLYAGPQGEFAGLDQVNVLLSPALAGRGTINLALTVDGKAANTVVVRIQ